MNHTGSDEYCVECDNAYRSYGCMMRGDSEKKSPTLRELLEKLSKEEYGSGQQHPEPWTPNSKALDEAELSIDAREAGIRAEAELAGRIAELTELRDEHSDRSGKVVTNRASLTKRIMRLERLNKQGEQHEPRRV